LVKVADRLGGTGGQESKNNCNLSEEMVKTSRKKKTNVTGTKTTGRGKAFIILVGGKVREFCGWENCEAEEKEG